MVSATRNSGCSTAGALGLWALSGGLGNGLFGGGRGYGHDGYGHEGYGHRGHGDCECYETKEAACLREQLAEAKAEKCAQAGDFAVYKEASCMVAEANEAIAKTNERICKLEVANAITDTKTAADLDCLKGTVNRNYAEGHQYTDTQCKFVDEHAKYEDERIWCRMPETHRYIPCREIVEDGCTRCDRDDRNRRDRD